MKRIACTLKIGMIILFYCKRSEYNTAQECLTETVGFTLGESLVKSKTGSYPQLCPLHNVFTIQCLYMYY